MDNDEDGTTTIVDNGSGSVSVGRIKTRAAKWESRTLFNRKGGLCNFSAVLVGNFIYITSSLDFSQGVFYLDTRTWTWHEWDRVGASIVKRPSYEANALLVRDQIYRFGGLSHVSGGIQNLSVLDLLTQTVTLKRSSGEELIPTRMSAAAYLESEDTIVAFAGDTSSDAFSPTDRLVGFNVGANTWMVLTTKGAPPQNRLYHKCCTYGRHTIFFYGGMGVNGTFYGDIHRLFCIRGGFTWTRIAFAFEPRYRHSICCAGNKMYIFGGFKHNAMSPTSDLLVYDIVACRSMQVQQSTAADQESIIGLAGKLVANADHVVVASEQTIFLLGGILYNSNEVFTLALRD